MNEEVNQISADVDAQCKDTSPSCKVKSAVTIKPEVDENDASQPHYENDASQPDNKTDSKDALSKTEEQKPSDAKLKKWKKRMRFQPKNVVLEKEEKHEYYKKLLDDAEAGDLEIPRAISVMEHASACSEEIKSMMSAIKQHSGNKTALQLLPRHLRRRAASHNVKRLPRRLREMAKQQAAGSADADALKKPPNRRKRRRQPNLQNEYAKRADKQGWLETHVWHAKRFHMSDAKDPHFKKWHCKVALYPNDKCFRACYRAVAKHCVVQDISFYKCLELEGSENNLCEMFQSITSASDKPLFNNCALNGEQESNILIYRKVASSETCVGPASVTWKPPPVQITDSSCSSRTTWLWLHPAIFETVHTLLGALTKQLAVAIRDVSDSLLRFRMLGPKSGITLLSVLRPYSTQEEENDAEKAIDQADLTTWAKQNQHDLLEQYKRFASAMKECHQQYFHQVTCQSAASCTDGSILPLVVNDPRLTLPLQKTTPSFKATKDSLEVDIDVPADIPISRRSPLWDSVNREEASSLRLPDHVVSTRKNEAKFSSEETKKKWIKELSTPIPVMVIRQGGYKSSSFVNPATAQSSGEESQKEVSNRPQRTVHGGPPDDFSSGFDLIIPSNWGMAFWIPIIYHRARAVGLRENLHTSMECRKPYFPCDYPDTEAGKSWWEAEQKKSYDDYYKKPPAKRPNYSVLASTFPFAPCWKYVFSRDEVVKSMKNFHREENQQDVISGINQDQSNDAENEDQVKAVKVRANVLVSDDLKPEKCLSSNSSNTIKKESLKRSASEDANSNPSKIARKDADSYDDFYILRDCRKLACLHDIFNSQKDKSSLIESLESFVSSEGKALVCVRVCPLNKGIPFPRSTICTPTNDDVITLRDSFNDLNGKGLSDVAGPVEKPHWDPYRKERKLATKEAKKNRKRKKESKVVIKSQERPSEFTVFPSRDIIGFVTSGAFLFSFATGGGTGFISLRGLLILARMNIDHIWLSSFLQKNVHSKGLLGLMRNVDCSQYRFVTLELL